MNDFLIAVVREDCFAGAAFAASRTSEDENEGSFNSGDFSLAMVVDMV